MNKIDDISALKSVTYKSIFEQQIGLLEKDEL